MLRAPSRRSAEAAYAAWTSGQELARGLLVRLADIDDGGALVRRPVLLAELDLDGARGPGAGLWWTRSSTGGCSRWTATGSRWRTRRC